MIVGDAKEMKKHYTTLRLELLKLAAEDTASFPVLKAETVKAIFGKI